MTAWRRRCRKRRQLLARQPACAYCGRPLTRETATLDHVIPKSRGGPFADENLALACRTCNRRKGDRLPGELLAWAVAVCRTASLFAGTAVSTTITAGDGPGDFNGLIPAVITGPESPET